jgi:hypothetical protein
VGALAADAKKRWAALKADLSKFSDLHPGELPVGIGICDVSREAPKTFLLSGGVYSALKEEVEPGFLSIVDGRPPSIVPPAAIPSTGRRAALASWLARAENPLTSRVMANRVWHYHFGRGIAGTPSDFGAMGEPPSHADLLDWLALELTRNGWSLKHLHRLILTSSTYRQSSSSREEAARIDPSNRLLWRSPRRRLEGEVIRDAALSVAGLLNPKMGGPSVFPELPAGMEGNGKWSASSDPAERCRRSVYVFVRRNLRYPFFEAFDMPDTHESCGRRNLTVTAPQALLYLNDKLILEWARSFADRAIESAGSDRGAQIEEAYRMAYSRLPDAAEVETARKFLERQRALLEERASAGGDMPPPTPPSRKTPLAGDPLDAAALADFCHVLINSSEFVYLN